MNLDINKTATILIADDEPTNRLVAKIALTKDNYEIIEATNGLEAIELAKQYKPDVILMDAMMPKMNGFEAIAKIKEIDLLKDIPILMITALDTKEDKIKAFESGANDYLSKPFDMQELLLRVRSFVKMRELYIQNLNARIDPSYNIPNIQALRDDLDNTKQPIGLFFQIRDFENLIYLYGLKGSETIVNDLLQKIKETCEIPNLTIYSISENRFVLFWDNEDEKIELFQIEDYANNLYQYIKENHFGEDVYTSDLKVNIVINTMKQYFIKAGILALKEAQKKNIPYLIADYIYQEVIEKVEHKIEMIKYIKKAITEDRIIPVYQAIMDAKTDIIHKYECLVRIKKEDGSLMSPFFFLDIAKQSDQYYTITKIMISKTFEYMKDKDCEFSINLSAIDIENSEILSFLFRKLDEYQVQNRLIIELLEDEVIHNFDKVLNFIQTVKKKGVRIAIDDYGSGYSNLERIFQYEPDFIKIDGSIIKGITEDKTKLAIAKSAVYLSKEIGVECVAEFVSNKEILKKCKEIGVDFLQGFYISEPLETIDNLHPIY